MPLMLTYDPVRHEQAESGASLFGGEMRLEEVVAILVGNSGPVVRDAEIGPPIGPQPEAKLDMAALGNRVDGVVDQIGSDFAEQQRVGPDAYFLRRFAQAILHLLRSGPGAFHSHGPRDELGQVNRFRGVGAEWSGARG